jgi:putative membrane protein
VKATSQAMKSTGREIALHKLAYALLAAHILALVFGLAGMLIALPNPHLWAASELGRAVFSLGMEHAGALHIVLGAVAMLAYSLAWLGARRAVIFLVVSVFVSLASELIGTATGWPFGNYAYEEGLGWKVLGRVPYTIPLSWYYMGLASLLISGRLLESRWPRFAALPILAALGGAWLLLGWDLVLDPAMAHESLPLKFWVWSETGSYFGMPLKNLGAWFLTGLVFMALSLRLWGGGDPFRSPPVGLPVTVYLANLAFASVISWSVGLWEPIVLALAWSAPLLVPLLLETAARRRHASPKVAA